MRVLGVDPGLTRCGVGVVEAQPGQRPRLVAVGVIKTSPEADISKRLLRIHDDLRKWVTQTKPEQMAVERVFSQHNLNTVIQTAQAAGLAMLIAGQAEIPVAYHTPSEVKAAISGSGSANKDQVANMVTKILGLGAPPQPADAADAVAVAICHLWRGSATNRLASATGAETYKA